MIDIARALKVEGWMAEAELTYLAEKARNSSSVAEVGCWLGRSTLAMALNTQGVVFAIDTWMGSPEHAGILEGKPEDWLYSEFLRNINRARNVIAIRMPSVEAAEAVGRVGLDFVFIDAAHDYDSVKADILAWRPLLREGGILAGHDYYGDYPGVAQAVNELVPDFRIAPDTNIWTTEGA
jgi:predicted O-methyltransferase YrrM